MQNPIHAASRPPTDFIPVFFSINDSYAPHLCAAMASILKNSTARFAFYILNKNVTLETEQKIRTLNGLAPHVIEFIKIAPSVFSELKTTVPYISVEACYRLMIPQLKPELDKAIYLDSDLVVLDDLQTLWDVDLGDAYCAAIDDYTPYESEGRRKLFEKIRYFNSGVMVFNLVALRARFSLEDYLDIEREHRDNIILQDQDILNLAYSGNVKYLPRRWNITYTYIDTLLEKTGGVTAKFQEEFEPPSICHFAGSQKPWISPRGVDAYYYTEAYFTYLRLTPYADFERQIFEDFSAWRSFFKKLIRHPKYIFKKRYRFRCKFRAHYEKGAGH
jgi:lipopolysaccharide biosynthesis glycosyltransferase